MRATDPIRHRFGASSLTAGSTVTLALSTCALAAGLLLSIWSLPMQLVLPTFCLVALAAAGIVALVAWRSGGEGHNRTYWDIAGALAFIGMCAAILSEPDQLIPLFEVASRDN